MEPLIEFRNVTKRFDDKIVLDRIDLKIYENQITTIIGKSGSGKSVLLKHIIGLLSPDEGEIFYRGKSIRKMSKKEWDDFRSQISYMFQNNALFDSMTVFDNVALPLRQTTDLGKKEIERRVMSRLEQMELIDVIHKYPSELSGGMQKRVALARALVTDPAVVLFDEPTTGQDPIRKNAILSMIAHYRKQFGFTAVVVSHDIPDVFFISDRILLLWEEKIAFQGTYEELSRLSHPMINEFLESMEGLRDELTGLVSKEIFRLQHSLTMGSRNSPSKNTALLFSISLELPADFSGLQAATEVLKNLGKYVDDYFRPLGGFSTRNGSNRILTLLPDIGTEEAEQLVHDFSTGLQGILPDIQTITGRKIGFERCFEISVLAGIAEVSYHDNIEQIIEYAAGNQKIIATYKCSKEDIP